MLESKCELIAYYTQRGDEVIILLVGGDKSSQQNDIAIAQDLMRNLQE